LVFRRAAIEDINVLVQLRIDYLVDDRGYLTDEEKILIIEQLKHYYERHINKDFIAVLAEDNGFVLSTAFLVVTEKPANPSFITGVTGTILNVFTYPEYRRKGIATKVISLLLEEGKKINISSFELFATEKGKPLYEKLGFVEPKCTAMRLRV
jgi:GNAT superfamily N-acetyltransferase